MVNKTKISGSERVAGLTPPLSEISVTFSFSSDLALSILDRLQNLEALIDTIWTLPRTIDKLSQTCRL